MSNNICFDDTNFNKFIIWDFKQNQKWESSVWLYLMFEHILKMFPDKTESRWQNMAKLMFNIRLILSTILLSVVGLIVFGAIRRLMNSQSQYHCESLSGLETFQICIRACAYLAWNFFCDVYEHPAMNMKYRCSYISIRCFVSVFFLDAHFYDERKRVRNVNMRRNSRHKSLWTLSGHDDLFMMI